MLNIPTINERDWYLGTVSFIFCLQLIQGNFMWKTFFRHLFCLYYEYKIQEQKAIPTKPFTVFKYIK